MYVLEYTLSNKTLWVWVQLCQWDIFTICGRFKVNISEYDHRTKNVDF